MEHFATYLQVEGCAAILREDIWHLEDETLNYHSVLERKISLSLSHMHSSYQTHEIQAHIILHFLSPLCNAVN